MVKGLLRTQHRAGTWESPHELKAGTVCDTSKQGLPGSPYALYSMVNKVQVPAGVLLLISLW